MDNAVGEPGVIEYIDIHTYRGYMPLRIPILRRIRNMYEKNVPTADTLRDAVRVRIVERSSSIPPIVVSRLLEQLAPESNLKIVLKPDDHKLRGCYYPKQHAIELWVHEPSVLLHELVHAIGGNELDSEVYERVLYPEDATTPDKVYDKYKFYGCDFVGRYAKLTADGFIAYGSLVLLNNEQTRLFLKHVL